MSGLTRWLYRLRNHGGGGGGEKKVRKRQEFCFKKIIYIIHLLHILKQMSFFIRWGPCWEMGLERWKVNL